MKKISLESGRVKQKQRTRDSILTAAKKLMKTNRKITLEDVAEKANVSRATIYRYFSDIDILIMESTLDIQHKKSDAINDELGGLDMRERLMFIQQYYNELAQQNENEFRRYLSSVLAESVAGKGKLRGARRVETLKASLLPFKSELSETDYKNLACIASLMMGIDALIVSKDVCRLSNSQSNDLLKWGLNKILDGIHAGSDK